MAKPIKLQVKEFDSEGGRVIVRFTGDVEAELSLSVTEVSSLVSGLYAARSEALKQPADQQPEVFLPICGVSTGSARDHLTLRIQVTEHLHQDFAAAIGSAEAELIRLIEWALATLSDPSQKPPLKH